MILTALNLEEINEADSKSEVLTAGRKDRSKFSTKESLLKPMVYVNILPKKVSDVFKSESLSRSEERYGCYSV